MKILTAKAAKIAKKFEENSLSSNPLARLAFLAVNHQVPGVLS